MFSTKCKFIITMMVSTSAQSNANEAVFETFCSTREWADYAYKDKKPAGASFRECVAIVHLDIDDHNEFASKCNLLFNNINSLIGVDNIDIRYNQTGLPDE